MRPCIYAGRSGYILCMFKDTFSLGEAHKYVNVKGPDQTAHSRISSDPSMLVIELPSSVEYNND